MEKQEHIKMHSYPGMVAVVGVKNEEETNFMAAGWHSYLSIDPPIYGVAIGRERFTYEHIIKNKAFTINFLPFEEASFIQYSGSVTGSSTNKVQDYNQKWYEANVGFPLLKRAYLAYECELQQTVPTGDHDWVIGKITACHYDSNLFKENGLPDFSKLHIPLYLGRSSYLKLGDSTQLYDIFHHNNNKKS
ncbi:flavin reductase family protein [Halobacillus shinanisalinarum]|uniref:Flavin reductase family protein n=1 Tax=Halobacillus shinanisalinarum TaxID=2932258 RepID=A0ABY4H0T7_9BACI|nr:flavin reductase family protein [Halobacillus shinanisalinarum]UOQ93783.1 flavin reductase family protein [Halobacillus shinanisalinarum]